MNSPHLLGPWLAPLGWLALEATVVILAALALQPLLRTAAARRTLWRAALLALVAVLAAELTGTGSQLPAQLRLAWQTTFPKPAPPLLTSSSTPELSFTSAPVFPLAPIGGEGRGEGAFTAPEPLQFEPAASLPPSPRSLSHSPTFSPAPALLWLTGIVALLARSAWTHAGFAWLRLRHFIPAAEALRERVAALAARLGLRRRVRVLASERLRTPAAFGWLRPGVVVPGDFTARFAPAQQDVMLAHELAHLAARDPLWQLLADLAAAALWWHPLVWVARRQHHIAGELAADDASLALPDGPVVLAECLLALGHEAADCPRAALGMAGFRSQLGRRVERLVALPPGDWQPAGKLRSFAQTTAALVLFAALALLPGCAANRTATEAPTRTIATWWQAKKSPVGDDVRSLTSADSGQRTAVSQKRVTSLPTNDQPVLIQGRVRFSGTPPAEHNIPLPPAVLAARTNAPMKTRFYRVATDGGLADVVVYVKAGLPKQDYHPLSEAVVVHAQNYEFQPYISAVQVGQPVIWDSVRTGTVGVQVMPTNYPNRQFSRVVSEEHYVENTFPAPELFIRGTVYVYPWMMHYLSVFDHPYFAVTDAEGRFRFPRPLPPGKYTLAAVHRRAGESTQEINLQQPLPAGQPLDVQFQLGAKEVSVAVPALPGPFTNGPLKSLNLRSYTPTVSLTREELLERKARVEVQITEAERTSPPTHPKLIGLRKQLESIEEALKQAAPKPGASLQPAPVGDDVRRLTSPAAVSQRLVTSSPTNALDISVGRQLFVDDFLIASNSLKRTWHQPIISQAPQLVLTSTGPLKSEFPFVEAVRYDLAEQRFRLTVAFRTQYAEFTSTNGTNWARRDYPALPEPPPLLLPAGAVTDYESHRIALVSSSAWRNRPDAAGVGLRFTRRESPARYDVEELFISTPRALDGPQWSNLHPLTNGFLVVGRHLHFYFGGRVQRPGQTYPGVAVGLATLRRDGFASLDAGPEGGVMTTKPVTFTGNFMFVNLKTNAPDGELRVEIVHPDGRPIVVTHNDTKQQSQPFALANAMRLAADQTLMSVNWSNQTNGLAMLVGRPVCFRFHLKNASLYSFWVGPSRFGRSLGRVAGGGPHFTNDVDTIGNRSYQPFPVVRTNTPAPKPGASLQPAPVGADVRRLTSPQTPDAIPQTPPASQRLVTSSPTNAATVLRDPADVAEAEALRRQEPRLVLDNLLGEARQFQKAKAWTNAVVRYEEASGHAKLLGSVSNVDKSYRDALAGLTHCRIQIATELQEKYQFKAAAAEVEKVLLFEPNSPKVAEFKKFNEHVEAAHDGRSSRQQAPAGPNELREARSKIMSLVRDGKLYYEVGEYLEARKRLEEAIVLDPENDAAFFYLRPVLEAQFEEASRKRFREDRERVVAVTKNWNERPRNNSQVLFPTHSSKGAQIINRKLDEITLPEVRFDSLVLPEVLKWLDGAAKKADPEPAPNKKGLNFLINNVVAVGRSANDQAGAAPVPQALDPVTGQPLATAAMQRQMPDLDNALVKVTTTLTNLTLRQTLDVICKTAEVKLPDGGSVGLKYSIEEYAIVFSPKLPEQPTLFSRMFKVDPEMFIRGLRSVLTDPSDAAKPSAAWAEIDRLLRDRAETNAPAGTGQFSVAGVAVTNQGKAGVSGVVSTNLNSKLNQVVRDYFRAAGVANLGVTNGPDATQVFFNDRNGLLLVRASVQDLGIIQMAIELLKVEPPQVLIEAKFATLNQNDLKALGFDWARTNAGILTAPQFAVLVRALEQRDGNEVASLPKVTTTSGKQAVIELPADAKAKGGVAQGVQLELMPTVAADGYTINLSVIMSRAGKAISMSQCVVRNGQTVMLGFPDAPAAGQPGAKPPRLLLFLTPTIVGPTGQRVHTDAEMPFIPAAPAKK